ADTFFYLALLNAKDRHHEKARELNRIDGPVVTSWWVMLELADHLSDVNNRHLFSQVLSAIQSDPRYELIPTNQRLLDSASRMYFDRSDKEWSLTDCTSFQIMQSRGLVHALTGDHHFQQAGFQIEFT
ncbi:MAG TPA: hypothetical protein VH518_25150, partial [Tepidisphaeraceae bacterium]